MNSWNELREETAVVDIVKKFQKKLGENGY